MRAVGWRLWLWWVLASTMGWAVGRPAGVAVGSSGDIIMAGYVGVTVGGVVAGVLQWLVLRRQVARAGWWVMASAVAAAIVGVVIFGVGVVSVDVGWVVGAGLFGTVLGVLQWRLVLRCRIARAGWWVLASTVGWVAGGPGVGFVSAIVGATWRAAVSWALLGAVYGAITGPVLVRLLRQPASTASAEE